MDSLKELPKVVFVKFRQPNGCDVGWHLEGTDEKGIYPIVPHKSFWHLDRQRQHPVVKISRRQFPFAQAFAMTAHAAQGQTLQSGAIVDLCVAKGADIMGGYVVLTWVDHRKQ